MSSDSGMTPENDPVLEELAAIEHERWSRWHNYAVKNWTPENVERWNRLADMRYDELPEHSKESDRAEVRRYYPKIVQGVAYQEEKAKGLVEALAYILEMNGCVNSYATIKKAAENALARYKSEGKERL
jgi:hypothetical protein